LDLAIAESGAEAWVVACSTSEHVQIASKLLQAGKTVLLEKPIADFLAEAESLSPLVNQNSSNLMLGHILLFNSEFRQLREEVSRRGRPTFIDCVRHRPASTRCRPRAQQLWNFCSHCWMYRRRWCSPVNRPPGEVARGMSGGRLAAL
jgi:predicted dehydrogenase